MPIPYQKAAELGREHRLTLADTKALAEMADDAEQAEELARTFTDTEIDYDALADQIAGGQNKGW